MDLMKFDQLNTLSTTETTKNDRQKVSRKKIPIHDYFENMQISEEEKEKRVRLANLLLADVLFLFALSKRNQDHHYLSEAFQKRYLSSVKKVTEPDQKMQRYIRKVCDSIVDTTLKGQKGGLLADSKANQPRDPYAVSMDRATNVAENEANTILNGDEYNAAIKNGCTKKRWTSYKDERVRADHADVDGQVIDINRPFHVGEYMMMYPKDDSLGAGLEEIVNCRCSVEYLQDGKQILKDDVKKDKDRGKGEQRLFVDVTEEYLELGKKLLGTVSDQEEYEKEGNTYLVDGKNVVLDYSESERKIAQSLADLLGANVKMIPRVLYPQKVSTPDIFINNDPYDIKEPIGQGKAVIYNMVSKKKRQANNFVIDITKCPLTVEEIRGQITDVYRSSHTKFIDKIILSKDGNILNIYKRSKKEE
jgi:hypothetical protein|nr:MAG TPA: minor capsid component [Caudoviricetes sp.]